MVNSREDSSPKFKLLPRKEDCSGAIGLKGGIEDTVFRCRTQLRNGLKKDEVSGRDETSSQKLGELHDS